MEKRNLKGYALVILSGIIYGFMPLMASGIYADGITPLSLVLFRNLFSLPLLAVLGYLNKRTIKVPLKAMSGIFAMAVFAGCLTPSLLYLSYRYIDSSVATVFHFIYPAAVLIIGVVFLKKKTNVKSVLSVLLCIFGVAMFNTAGLSLNLTGTVFALVSGVTYAIYIVIVSAFKFNKEVPTFLLGFYFSLITSIIMFVLCLVTNQLIFPSKLSIWILTIFFAIILNVGALLLFQKGALMVGGEKAAVLSATEPITSLIVGIIVLGDHVTVKSVIGAAAVIIASILISASKNKE